MRPYGNRVGPSSSVAGALRREEAQRHTRERSHMVAEAEFEILQLQLRECQELERRGGRGGLTLAGFRGNRTLPHLDF